MSAELYCQACQMYHMPVEWYKDQIEKAQGVLHPTVVTILQNNQEMLRKHLENVDKHNEGDTGEE